MSHAAPLQASHNEANAVTAEFGGWALPAHFGDSRAEYQAARESAAVFDISHTGRVELTGPDAPMFLHNLSTNDITNMPLGGGCEAYFCDHRAKALFHTRVYHARRADGSHAMWLDVTPGYQDKLLAHLDKYRISEDVEFADRSAEFVQLHIAGPKAKGVIEAALDDAMPDLGPYQHMERTFGATATCSIRRVPMLGVPGYDIVCLNERAAGVWRMLLSCGAKPAGLEPFEVLRVEAGTPLYGVDVDESRFVMEAHGAAAAVSYEKGCFLGQEPIVMARDRAGRVNRSAFGLKLTDRAVDAGSKVFHGDEAVGVTTSSVPSFGLGVPVALAYLKWGHQEPGTEMQVEDDKGRQDAEVVTLPMV